MRCLLCNKDLTLGASLSNLLFDSDLICFKCRKELTFKPLSTKLMDTNISSLYLYDESFSKLLLQYKECYDEALADVFLYPFIQTLRKKYRGYTIVLAPSSINNLERRGFNHLLLMFKCLKLPIIDCLYKDSNINQNNLSFEDRLNVSNHIFLKDVKLPSKILLVDDVLTSGATLIGCIKNLKDKVQKIEVLTIAYNKHYLNANKA